MTLLLSAALAFVVVEMSVTYLVARRLRNFGIVDVVWSLGFGPIAALFYLVAPRPSASPPAPLASPALVFSSWSPHGPFASVGTSSSA